MTHWEFSHIPFDGDLTDDEIVCQKCGWHWKVKDGGDDLYVCHKCYTDNSNYYLPKDTIYSNADYSQAITQGVSAIGSIGSSVAQSKANKEAGKTNIEREIETRCGKDKSKSWSKKKKTAFITCRDSVIQQLDTDKKISAEQKQKQLQVQQQALLQNSKQQRNQTYIVVGIIALILGFAIYKKMNK
jgi:hypothetical protein